MYLSIGASNPEEIRQGNTGMFYVYCQKMHTQRGKDTERLRDIWTDAQTEDVGGEDDGAAGLGRAGDVGSEAPW